jgi:tetratricopeptide (TPR) repeat protein
MDVISNQNCSRAWQPKDRLELLAQNSYYDDWCVNNPSFVRFSEKELGELTPITLSEMLVATVHSGRYLACRTINMATCYRRISVVVEDLNDHVEELLLYNMVNKLHMNMDDMMPIGTILIIKEPFLLGLGSTAKRTCIRCDSPSDVVFVNDNNPILIGTKWFVNYDKSQFKWLKAKGNAMYKTECYHQALRFYLNALGIEPLSSAIHLNISATLRQLERYQEAYDHASKAFDLDKTDKALYHKGLSSYKMRDWSTALGCYGKIKEIELVNDEINACRQRLDEASTGLFNWDQIYHQTTNNQNLNLDVADFLGPVKVVDIVDKGKGMVVTRDIDAGELLLVYKAFSLSNIDNGGGVSQRGTLASLVTNTITALKNRPTMAKDVYSLYAGSSDRNVNLPNGIVDTDRIGQICTYNRFSREDLELSEGLWIMPAYINHSCDYNTKVTFFGDIFCLRSTRPIKADEELTVQYMDTTTSLSRRSHIFDFYNFVCNCRLCDMDRSDKNYSYREKLINDKLEDTLSESSLVLLENFINQVKSTFEDRTEMRYQLIPLLNSLAYMYNGHEQYQNELNTYEEILAITDGHLHDITVSLLIEMAAIYLIRLSKPDMAKDTLAKAVDKSKIFFETKNMFKLKHAAFLTNTKLLELI